jgi:hypothetical protein
MIKQTARLNLLITLLSLLLCQTASLALDEEQIRQIIKASPGADSFPEASAVILFRETSVTLKNDLDQITEEEVLLKILSDQAKNIFGDLKIMYDSRYETIAIEAAQTFTPANEIIPIMEGADNVITPPELLDAAVYGAVKQRVISFSGVETGSILHWRTVKQTSYPKGDRFLWGNHSFASEIPIVKESFILKARHDLTLSFRLLNKLEEPVIADSNEFRIFTWVTQNTPMIVPEWGMIPVESIVPRLLYTTAPSWTAISGWFRDIFESDCVPDADIRNRVRQLTEDLNDETAKIGAIYRWVADSVRNINVPLGLEGYRPNSPSTIFHNRCGDSRDKTVLLLTMLRAADLRADTVLFQSSGINVPADFPSISSYDALGIIAETTKKAKIWLDPQGVDLQAGYFPRAQGTVALRIKPEDFELVYIPVTKPEMSVSYQTLLIDLNPDGSATVTLKWQGSGYFDSKARKILREKTPVEQENFLAGEILDFDRTARITSIKNPDWDDFSRSVAVQIEFTCSSLAVNESGVTILRMPVFPLRFGRIEVAMGKSERLYPVEMDATGTERMRVEIQCPKGFEPLYIPEKKLKSSPGLKIQQNAQFKNNKIIIDRISIYRQQKLQPVQFTKTLSVFDQFRNVKQNLILLENR